MEVNQGLLYFFYFLLDLPRVEILLILVYVTLSFTLNALHQPIMLHLWLNHPFEQCPNNLLPTQLNLKRRGRGRYDKYFAKRIIHPTNGRLR